MLNSVSSRTPLSLVVDLRLWHLAQHQGTLHRASMALAWLVSLTWWVQAAVLAELLHLLVTGGPTQAGPVVGWLVGCWLLRVALVALQADVSSRLGQAVRSTLRGGLMRAMISPASLHSHEERLGARRLAVTDGVEGIDAYVTRYIPAALQAWTLPLLGVAILATLNLGAALAVAIGVLIALLGPKLWSRALAKRGEERWGDYEALASDYLESLRSMATLRLLGAVSRRREILQARSDALHRRTMATMRLSLIDTGLVDLGVQAGYAAAVALAVLQPIGILSIPGGATPYLVLMLASECFRPVRDLARAWHAGYLGLTALTSLEEILSPPERTSPRIAVVGDRVCLSGIRHRWGENKLVLDGVDLELRVGELVALTGPSGTGKSTLLDIILGFVEPSEGKVSVPGRVILVPQDSRLFPGTVAHNLRMGDPHATDDQLWGVLRRVGMADTVAAWSDGLASTVGESGRAMSGGQRQRLSIARALLCPAPVLLLDEPTSGLDDDVADVVCQALQEESDRRIVLMVAHRGEALAAADRVVALNAGKLEVLR